MRAHLQRQGVPVARPAPILCRHPLAAGTVERIMRHNGWRGVMRARRPPRTTEPDPAARRAPDLVGRRWRVAAPNLLEVADFTYVPLGTGGFGYTAFVVDAYAGLIPGWECSMVKDTGFVERALRHAAAFRSRQGYPFDHTIHHSDAGSQGGFNWSSQHLDHGGVVWRSARTRSPVVLGGGSGRLIVRCGRRCGHRGGRSRRVLCSDSSGG
jgi:putative transposase